MKDFWKKPIYSLPEVLGLVTFGMFIASATVCICVPGWNVTGGIYALFAVLCLMYFWYARHKKRLENKKGRDEQ